MHHRLPGRWARVLPGRHVRTDRVRGHHDQGRGSGAGRRRLRRLPPGADFVDCVFAGNVALTAGGGVFTFESPTFLRCIFSENSAGEAGGGFVGGSGGTPASTTFDGCQFNGNTAGYSGGALLLENITPTRQATVRGCTFLGNNTEGIGGAIGIYSQAPLIEGCTFALNGAPGGGVIDCSAASVTIRNCIIALSAAGSALACNWGGTAALACCDVYGNAGGDWVGCLAGQEGQNGNLALDPLFCDPAGGNLYLQEGSPCAPQFNPACGMIGALPVGCGTPVGEISWGRLKALYR